MTFLELVNRTKQECGISGADLSTVLNQTGEARRLVNWVSQAWADIQNARQDWDFMKQSVIFDTVAGKQSYLPGVDINITNFKKWENDSFRMYLKSAGIGTEITLSQYYDHNQFRDFYLVGSRRLVTGRPIYVTIWPDKSLYFGFIPNDVYTATAQYWIKAQILALDNDTPNLPDDYHMLIVYKAMMKYGMFESAAEQIAAAKEEYAPMFSKLVADHTPYVSMGASLI